MNNVECIGACHVFVEACDRTPNQAIGELYLSFGAIRRIVNEYGIPVSLAVFHESSNRVTSQKGEVTVKGIALRLVFFIDDTAITQCYMTYGKDYVLEVWHQTILALHKSHPPLSNFHFSWIEVLRLFLPNWTYASVPLSYRPPTVCLYGHTNRRYAMLGLWPYGQKTTTITDPYQLTVIGSEFNEVPIVTIEEHDYELWKNTSNVI